MRNQTLINIITTGIIFLGLALFVYAAYNITSFHLSSNSSNQSSLDELNIAMQSIEEPAAESKQEPQQINNEQVNIPLYSTRPNIGDVIGELKIPAINESFHIYFGTDDEVLEMGVGHYPGSVLPGEPDHTILSGHRDTVFRGLKDVQLEDKLIVSTAAGTFTYEVTDIYIVDADDTTVIRPTGEATLSLTTCYPFYYVGNAPERYIIEARLVNAVRN